MKINKGVYQAFPDKMCVSLKNDVTLNWVGTTGAINAFMIDGNNLHNSSSASILSGANPLSVGTAVSIYGLGNLLSQGPNSAGIYNGYRVISSKITSQTINTTSATTDGSLLIVLPMTRNAATTLGNINTFNQNTLLELPFAVNNQISGATINNGVKLSTATSTAKMFGLEYRSTLEDPLYAGFFGAAVNTVAIWDWVIMWFPQTAQTTTGTTQLSIEYYVEFFSRNDLVTASG